MTSYVIPLAVPAQSIAVYWWYRDVIVLVFQHFYYCKTKTLSLLKTRIKVFYDQLKVVEAHTETYINYQ